MSQSAVSRPSVLRSFAALARGIYCSTRVVVDSAMMKREQGGGRTEEEEIQGMPVRDKFGVFD